jgi:hypothetical protein
VQYGLKIFFTTIYLRHYLIFYGTNGLSYGLKMIHAFRWHTIKLTTDKIKNLEPLAKLAFSPIEMKME